MSMESMVEYYRQGKILIRPRDLSENTTRNQEEEIKEIMNFAF
jgi:hypothetical protein